MNNEKRNMLILVISSAVILFGFHYFYEKPRLEKLQAEMKATQAIEQPSKITPHSIPQNPMEAPAPATPAPLSAQQVDIKSRALAGSLSTRGFEISNLTLKRYKETIDAESPEVTLLKNKEADSPYFAQFGWRSPDSNIKVPTQSTVWSTEASTLVPGSPVVMTWDNGEGLVFKRTIEVDQDYMFTVHQTVLNKTDSPLSIGTHGRIVRTNPSPSNYVVLHEGAVGYLDNKLVEVKYDDLKKDGKKSHTSKGGWLGITDKYWLAALAPDQNITTTTQFKSEALRTGTSYEASFEEPLTSVDPGTSFTTTTHFFAGAKSLDLLDHYEEVYNIPHFDLAIDFGWFYFITKPLFFALKWLYALLGNFGVAILVLTILVRLSFFPLANHSFHAMAKMRELQPEITRLKTVYGDDKARFQQEMMGLYKKHKVNPVAGCMPILIQIPVFFALYKVLFVSLEMRHAPFFGWIQDLSAPDPTTLFNLFGLISWTPPSFLMIGVLPILMALSMLVQQKLNPQPTDPIQEKVFKFMPLLFLFMLANFPSGLVLYWICSNIFSILQQLWQIKQRQKKAK